jgi:hypothetical protein
VLRNLLDNAIKYSPQGGTITLQAYQDEAQIVFSIKDEGIGIPAEERNGFSSASIASKTKSPGGCAEPAWAWRCVAASSKRTADAFGSTVRPERAAPFASHCRLRLESGQYERIAPMVPK